MSVGVRFSLYVDPKDEGKSCTPRPRRSVCRSPTPSGPWVEDTHGQMVLRGSSVFTREEGERGAEGQEEESEEGDTGSTNETGGRLLGFRKGGRRVPKEG